MINKYVQFLRCGLRGFKKAIILDCPPTQNYDDGLNLMRPPVSITESKDGVKFKIGKKEY